jgi:hypothetical protein
MTIVAINQAIPKPIADAAHRSLDKEIARQREEGKLEAGKASSVRLEWTVETREAITAFGAAFEAVCANL